MPAPLGQPGGVFSFLGVVWVSLFCSRFCLLFGSFLRRCDMRALLPLFILFFTSFTHAAFAPTSERWYRFQNGVYNSGTYAPIQTACDRFSADWTAKETFKRPSYGVVTAGKGCEVRITATGALGVASGPIYQDNNLVCPANATLDGTSCVCNAGYLEQSATCVPEPPPTCPVGSDGGGYYFTVPPGAPSPQYAQQDGSRCVIEYRNMVCTVAQDGTRHCHAQSKLTGDYCPSTGCTGDGSAPGSPSPTPPEDTTAEHNGPCQKGYYYGTVNGQTVCVPGQGTSSSNSTSTTTTGPSGTVEKSQSTVTTTGTSPNGTQTTQTTQTTLEKQWSAARQITNQSESSYPSATIPTNTGETKTTTVTNPDGSKTEYTLTKNPDGTVSGRERDLNTVQKTETTTCTGSSCTVSSTTNTNGQQTGSTEGTTDKDGLCKESPDNAQCGDGDGMFAGTCSAGFQCQGDAVQCAIAKKQHEAACAFLENKTAESELYEAEKNKPGNVTGDNPNNSTEVISSSMFDYSSATGGGSCIPNKTITVMGQSIDLPFSNICTWLEVLGNVLVSVSSLIALRIVMRG